MALVGLLATGCYSTVRVRPEELPKLNDSYANVMGYTACNGCGFGSPIVNRTVRHLVAEDGTIVEVKGEAAVSIQTHLPRPLEFEHPVMATMPEPMLLEIAGGNRARTHIPVDDIRSVEVTTYDPEKTMWAALGIGTAAAVVLTVIVVASMPETPDYMSPSYNY